MTLDDLASGLTVTHEQRERGVATVDRTARSLADRLAPHDDALPCDGATAATIVERYAAGGSVGTAGRTAGVPPMTAAKTLHLLGESVSPLGPTGRDVVRDWIAGELSRAEAETLARASPAEFALAAYVETHDPLPAARAAVEGDLSPGGDAASLERQKLGDALQDPLDQG
jgi:hypothetical protein